MQEMKELKHYLKPLYKHNTERICSEIISYAKDFPRNENPYPNLLWHKFLNLYAIYPDGIENGDAAPLARLIPHLAHIKETSSLMTSRRWGVQADQPSCQPRRCFLH
jgi:hypothetical protein